MSEDVDRGDPYVEVEPKRSFDKVPIQIDWHDYLINLRIPGMAVAQGFVMRPRRADSTGVQYRCTTAGVTSRVPWGRIAWPTSGTVQDGTVVWTAEAITDDSLRTTVAQNEWLSVPGLTLSGQSNADHVYTTMVGGGVSGQRYEIAHRITLANGEQKEGVIVLPVQD